MGIRNSSRSISPGCVGSQSVGTRIMLLAPMTWFSVVIGDLHVLRPIVGPHKSNSVMLVDAMLHRSLSFLAQFYRFVPRIEDATTRHPLQLDSNLARVLFRSAVPVDSIVRIR